MTRRPVRRGPSTARRRVPGLAGLLVGLAALCTVLLAGCGGHGRAASAAQTLAPAGPSASAPSASAPSPSDGGAADSPEGFRSPRTHPTVAEPVRLSIPSIGVDSSLERLGLDATGAVAAPKAWQQAGWYADGVRPGQAGPAVLLGHVDSKDGPAVFYRLATVRPGAAVVVRRADGSAVRFVVTGALQVAKSRFPADLVYAPTLEPSLRLVTCGGTFDARTGHYRDNVIVTARLERPAS